MQNKLQLILTVLLIVIATFTAWMIITSHHMTFPKNKPQDPDSFTIAIDAIQFNELGKPHHIFKSPKLTTYLQHNTTDIQKPFYIFKNTNERPWHIQADHGKAYNGTNTIVLTGNVKIQQLPGQNSRNITLLTHKMIFYPKRSFAKTDQPVTIKQPGMIVHGVGLEADLKKGDVKLLSKTRGEYIAKD